MLDCFELLQLEFWMMLKKSKKKTGIADRLGCLIPIQSDKKNFLLIEYGGKIEKIKISFQFTITFIFSAFSQRGSVTA